MNNILYIPSMDQNTKTTLTLDASTVPKSLQADSDEHLVRLWLHGRSLHTIDGYARDAQRFINFVNKPLASVTLDDIQRYADVLTGISDNTRKRKLYAIKSLLAFGHRLGYLTFDVGAPVRVPTVKDTLAERILSDDEVRLILKGEKNPRNHAILRLLYAAGLRVSELCGLRWRDVVIRNTGAQLTIFGKGRKTRFVKIPKGTYQEIQALYQAQTPDDPVFKSKKGKALSRSQVFRIVKAASERAGLWQNVSPHWMRHAHASHALDAGAPIHLVQSTLGHASVATTGRYAHARPQDSSARYVDAEDD